MSRALNRSESIGGSVAHRQLEDRYIGLRKDGRGPDAAADVLDLTPTARQKFEQFWQAQRTAGLEAPCDDSAFVEAVNRAGGYPRGFWKRPDGQPWRAI